MPEAQPQSALPPPLSTTGSLRSAVQGPHASATLAEQALEVPLETLARKTPVVVGADTTLAQALRTMHERQIGSLVVVDAAGGALGILTRHDILGARDAAAGAARTRRSRR